MSEVIGQPIPASEWNNKLYTDKGDIIVAALEPLHTTPVKLKSEIEGAVPAAQQLYGTFDLRCESGMQVISLEKMREDLSYAVLFLLKYPTSNLKHELAATFDRSMTYGFSPFLDEHLDTRYISSLRGGSPDSSIFIRIGNVLDNPLFAAIHDPLLTNFPLALQTLRTHTWNTLRQAVVYEVLMIVRGDKEEADKLAQLVSFFVKGNYLLGRSKEGKGIVFTA